MGLDICIEKIKKTEIGYIRKAYFLQEWLYKRGYEVDNNNRLELRKPLVEMLIADCKAVVEDNTLAKRLLENPDREYDTFYFNTVEWVLNVLEKVLPEFDNLEDDDEQITIKFC
jgi:hypothetical protein